jgi:hypothetical protein
MFILYAFFLCCSILLKELGANIRFREGFRGVKGFGGLYETAEAASAVYMSPRKPNFFRRSFVQKTTFLCIKVVDPDWIRIQ